MAHFDHAPAEQEPVNEQAAARREKQMDASLAAMQVALKDGDGKAKDEVPGALASKPEWLPPRRP